ncbi:transketolase [Blautia marasmi]|uniref:transketolase n=1 Tax=Blautia marasmi TaxID=1917868 RepID=UPI000CF2D4B8|nr:transketolase [Blautia marasmi]
MLKSSERERLVEVTKNVRKDILEMGPRSGCSVHIGGSLSCVEILTTLYYKIMRIDPENPKWEDRDRFILSKGHSCAALYAVLSRKGFFDRELLWKYHHINSKLQGHPDMKKTPGIDMTSGSLGNGLSLGLGMAKGLKKQKKTSQVYVVLGDGEIQEGMVWEAALAAGDMHMDNLTAVVDYNHIQSGTDLNIVMPLHPLVEKWKAFGWNVLEANGHDLDDLYSKLDIARNYTGRPTVIIANTVKGKGVSFIEHNGLWHNRMITEEEMKNAFAEIDAADL